MYVCNYHKQVVRFEKRFYENYNNYPWVKYCGSGVKNNPTTNNPVKHNNKIIYRTPAAGDQLCYFSKSICTPQSEVDPKIKFEIKKNYKFFSISQSKNLK